MTRIAPAWNRPSRYRLRFAAMHNPAIKSFLAYDFPLMAPGFAAEAAKKNGEAR
jgi:hypothetical protein